MHLLPHNTAPLAGTPPRWRSAALIALAAALTACSGEQISSNDVELRASSASSKAEIAIVNRDLAALRSAMARYHSFDVAYNEGQYNHLFLGMCMEDQSTAKLGGMGLHYVRVPLDGEVELTSPEALLYEPGPGGKLVLVAVEYAIPVDQWTEEAPPRLFGQDFTPNEHGLWALHVWAWKNNPAGMFKPWNPNVSCKYATHVGAH